MLVVWAPHPGIVYTLTMLSTRYLRATIARFGKSIAQIGFLVGLLFRSVGVDNRARVHKKTLSVLRVRSIRLIYFCRWFRLHRGTLEARSLIDEEALPLLALDAPPPASKRAGLFKMQRTTFLDYGEHGCASEDGGDGRVQREVQGWDGHRL
eukprot:COSAG02_NODE_784_length_17232_cov_12.871651_20_plen_152_part_00